MLSPLESIRFCILLALAEEPLHGAAIQTRIVRDSRGEVYLQASTVYKTLKILEEKAFIERETIWQPGQTTYKLTRKGHDKLQRELSRLEQAIQIGKSRLSA